MKRLLKSIIKRIDKKEHPGISDYSLYEHQRMVFNPDDCTSVYGFGFGQRGGHYLVETAKQVMDNPYISYEDSVLKRYFDNFHPNNMSEVFGLNEKDKCYKWLAQYQDPENAPMPWTPEKTILDDSFYNKKGDYGPRYDSYIDTRFDKIKRLVNSIKEKGYSPDYFSNSEDHIRGVLLKNNSSYRFLVVGGNHRAAILSALGLGITAEFHRSYPNIIDLNNAGLWPCVKLGIYPEEVARLIFLKYFDEDGREKAKAWNII